MNVINRDKAIDKLTELYKNSSGDSHVAYRTALDTIYEMDFEENKNALEDILYDYGLDDEATLRGVLDTFQKVVNEMSHGMLSKLTYDPQVYVEQFTEKFKEAYGHVEIKVEDELPITYRSIVFETNDGDVFSGYFDATENKFVSTNLKSFDEFDKEDVYSWHYQTE